MNIFDIVGPVMVGPSSSHTAGAVRIGQVFRKLLGERIKINKNGKLIIVAVFIATIRALKYNGVITGLS